MKTLHFATSNMNKLREAKEILGLPLEHIDIDLPEIQSTDVFQVVQHKAKAAYEATGKTVLVEDTGLYIHAWNGLPGALIKWFMKHVGKEGIITMLAGFAHSKATAVCCVGYYDGKEYVIETGEVNGNISFSLLGESSFGWDPIFIPEGYEKSFAQMTAEEKNAISHRGNAFRALHKRLL